MYNTDQFRAHNLSISLFIPHLLHDCTIRHSGEWSGRDVQVRCELCEGVREKSLNQSNHSFHVYKRHLQINLRDNTKHSMKVCNMSYNILKKYLAKKYIASRVGGSALLKKCLPKTSQRFMFLLTCVNSGCLSALKSSSL